MIPLCHISEHRFGFLGLGCLRLVIEFRNRVAAHKAPTAGGNTLTNYHREKGPTTAARSGTQGCPSAVRGINPMTFPGDMSQNKGGCARYALGPPCGNRDGRCEDGDREHRNSLKRKKKSHHDDALSEYDEAHRH